MQIKDIIVGCDYEWRRWGVPQRVTVHELPATADPRKLCRVTVHDWSSPCSPPTMVPARQLIRTWAEHESEQRQKDLAVIETDAGREALQAETDALVAALAAHGITPEAHTLNVSAAHQRLAVSFDAGAVRALTVLLGGTPPPQTASHAAVDDLAGILT